MRSPLSVNSPPPPKNTLGPFPKFYSFFFLFTFFFFFPSHRRHFFFFFFFLAHFLFCPLLDWLLVRGFLVSFPLKPPRELLVHFAYARLERKLHEAGASPNLRVTNWAILHTSLLLVSSLCCAVLCCASTTPHV